MSKLRKEKGKYIVSNISLKHADELLLEHGGVLSVDVNIRDNRYMSVSQRNFIFKLCREVEYETGVDHEIFRADMMNVHNSVYNKNLVSLTEYSMTDANELINITITFMIDKEITLRKEWLDKGDFNFTKNHIYQMCFKRICVVCGTRAEIHHVDAVGMGRDRKKISHIGLRVLPICRFHHNEAHTIGDKGFIEKYHLEPVKIDKKLEHFIKTGKVRVFE